MKDTLFVIKTLLRLLIDYPVAVVHDFIWFKLNYRPKWLRNSRKKHFDRIDNDKVRLSHIATKVRFLTKKSKDSRS